MALSRNNSATVAVRSPRVHFWRGVVTYDPCACMWECEAMKCGPLKTASSRLEHIGPWCHHRIVQNAGRRQRPHPSPWLKYMARPSCQTSRSDQRTAQTTRKAAMPMTEGRVIERVLSSNISMNRPPFSSSGNHAVASA